MGGSSAGGAEVVRGSVYPLQKGVEGRAEPRAELGESGTIGTGKGDLIV